MTDKKTLDERGQAASGRCVAIDTHPEMNKKIVSLLRLNNSPMDLYAAQRIEELEKLVREISTQRPACEARYGTKETLDLYGYPVQLFRVDRKALTPSDTGSGWTWAALPIDLPLDGIGDTPVEALWDLQGAIEHRIMLSKNQGFNMPKPSVWDVKQQRLREP